MRPPLTPPKEGDSSPRESLEEDFIKWLIICVRVTPLFWEGQGGALLYSLLQHIADEVVELLHGGDEHALVG